MAVVIGQARQTPVSRSKRKIPDYLICEVLDGKPLYYRGYEDVMAGKKTLEEIMGSSSLQALLISYLAKIIFSFIDDEKYFVLISEPGVHLDNRDNLSNDIGIYDQAILTPAKISKKYTDVPPKIVIEVDISIAISELTETGYIYKKTGKLLGFGVEKIIWVLTEAQVVMVATKESIETFSWDKNIELMDGQEFNIGAFLAKKGIVVE
ncbi:Uma2 family endonuclease [Larkinella punicea]|uniref:Uma2 family endonuclease n=1 Tax=Larkinella punicea TaxID=2315727 RepID=A0A368JPY8_9BACT|nr:Uma2 family endonuclease [Larkinella punicea]RCR69385.1 Uma2 family endonuclease [Larkinella punicea]